MAAESGSTTAGNAIRPRLDHRGFPLATDDQRRQANREWISRIDPDAVCALAARYYEGGNTGRHTRCRVFGKHNGSFNVCFFVVFDDGSDNEPSLVSQPSEPPPGVKWVVRIPLAPAIMDNDPWLRLQSEVVTMRYLQLHTRIPIPHIHAFGQDARLMKTGTTSRADHKTQSFLITDFVEGEPLEVSKLEKLDTETRQLFLGQVVDILADLRALEFPRIGCLLPNEPYDSFPSQPSLGPVQFLPSTNLLLPQPPPAPFSSARAYMRYRYRMLVAHFQEPYRDHNIDGVRREIFALHQLQAAYEDVVGKHDNGPFVLNHADPHASNIIVDSTWRVRGVLDWEYAATVPLPVFTPPSWVTGHDAGRASRLQRNRQRAVHADFYAVLAKRAQTNTVCATLLTVWYKEAVVCPGPSSAEPQGADGPTAFCVAHCLRRSAEAAHTFYEFLAPEPMRPQNCDEDDDNNDTNESGEKQVCEASRLREQLRGFFDENDDLAADAQRLADTCARYTAYLKENGLYETERDRQLARFHKLKKEFDLKMKLIREQWANSKGPA
ncbi:phosphotransferase enzyme family protein [Niveomyces insectorum RCEF 264]|uniref:Phosphotransferase enzyme family protein n=1 Tax=Niveomyces insectorum RCEF 264 TaxID=1081102 RepID=A0A167W6K7_9HYPO|nr:phosphotransferase enzyme family protein [Niveomyces insectorum RCEF 264]